MNGSRQGKVIMTGRFFLHAPNVHCGGGLTLLLALIESLPDRVCLIIDERLPLNDELLNRFDFYRIKPTVYGRFKAEILLNKLVKAEDEVLCFGNLPPLFYLKAKVMLFIQNRYLVESLDKLEIPFKFSIRLMLEKFWFKTFQKNVGQIIVQTLSMKALVSEYTKSEIVIAPFVPHTELIRVNVDNDNKIYDFVYVASGEAHKNHIQLLDAWCLLAEDGMFPLLVLTLDKKLFPELCMLIEQKNSAHQLRIYNKGLLKHDDIKGLYKSSKALIYPSVFESFGLPLIEAKQFGLDILAPELDYVRDLVEPEQTFEPKSARSIARSVKRYLGKKEPSIQLDDAKTFLEKIRCNNDSKFK